MIPLAPPSASASSSSSSSRRPIDITVFGCTGNAGRGVAFQLMRSALMLIANKNKSIHNNKGEKESERTTLRIGLAGRNRSKVETTLQGLKQELALLDSTANTGHGKLLDITILVADANDPASMAAMTASSTVVISCAGPFARYGEACVQACIEHGAHYLDITGEVDWVSEMIHKYDEQAQEAGVTLLPFSGYDCVPAELSLLLTNEALALNSKGSTSSSSPSMVLRELNLAFGGKGGGFPRGTLNTILDALDGKGKDSSKKKKNSDDNTKNFARFYPTEYKATVQDTLSARNFLFPKWSHHVHQYTGPNFMASVNAPVLCRSAAAVAASSSPATTALSSTRVVPAAPFVMSDRSIVSGPPTLLNGYGLLPTQLYIVALVFSGIAFLLPPVRSWLRNKLTTYSFAGNPDGNVVVTAEGIPDQSYSSSSSSSSSSTTQENQDTSSTVRATMKMVVPGDAGIYATGLFVVAVAETLLEVVVSSSSSGNTGTNSNKSFLPAGFHPPVVALHHAAADRGGGEDGHGIGGSGLLVRNLCRLGAEINLELIDDGATNTKTVLDPTTMRNIQSKL